MTTVQKHVLIGIDPGTGKKIGVAVYSVQEKRLLQVCSVTYEGLRSLLDENPPPLVKRVLLEDARQLPVYNRNRHASREARDKIARNVGRVDQVTAMIEDLLIHRGFTVELRPPSGNKPDKRLFALYTGWTKRSNQHGRDAAMMVIARS